jgi:hypothetical protein
MIRHAAPSQDTGKVKPPADSAAPCPQRGFPEPSYFADLFAPIRLGYMAISRRYGSYLLNAAD